MSNARFIALIGYLLAGMIVWAAAFTVAYTAAAIVCARRLGDVAVLGIPMLAFSIGAITVVALVATGAIALVAYRRQPQAASRNDTDPRGFIEAMALIVALMAIVGIVWNGLPALFFLTCQ
jgi:hypothetical protein